MIITQTFTMARWKIVVKRSETRKQTKEQITTKQKTTTKQTNNQTNKQQQQNRRMEVEGYKANNYSNVIINIDLRETHTQRERVKACTCIMDKLTYPDFYRFTSGRCDAKKRGL